MKKSLKLLLWIIGSLVGLLVISAVVTFLFVKANIFNVEKVPYYDGSDIQEISVNGFNYRDLNGNGQLDVYEDPKNPLVERADDLLARLTPDEKIRLLKGTGMEGAFGSGSADEGISGAVGKIVPIPRLGIPTVYLSDGPAGLRINPTRKDDDNTYYSTAFPIGTMLASTWNTELVESVGRAMGKEVLEYGIDVILGPGANIHRGPLCGRNFEYYSEDPVLTGDIGAAMVNGIESNGVGTSLKHFVANNQETSRNVNDVIVSERALREIYLKGFEIIVKKSQPWTIMSSFNKVNGTYTSESRDLLTDILRDDWGFEGVVMTDWFGGKHPAAQIHAGNDLLEPGTKKQYKTLRKAAENGTLSQEDIDTSVRRILKLILNSPKMEPYAFSNQPDLEAHAEITRQSADEGMILLKNEGALPIGSEVNNIALFGVASYDFIAGGTGSGDVNEAYTVSLEEGLRNAGYVINTPAKDAFEAHKAAHADAFEKPEGTIAAMTTKYAPPQMILSEDQLMPIVNTADMAMITIGRNSGEGFDRVEKDDFLLTADEQELMSSVCEGFHAAGKQVVVVLNIGGVIETASWKAQPDAILLAWQAGQEGGNSAADVLSGKVNPSGKLPMTFPVALKDHASSANFPMTGEKMNLRSMMSGSKEKSEKDQVQNLDYTLYVEGIYVGYRHFDKNNLPVSYPFGFGLSYTDFEFGALDAEVSEGFLNIRVTVKNTGDTAGKEVAEIYLSKPDSNIDRPVRELKAFAKTPLLNPGETAGLAMRIPVSDLSYWDEATSGWNLEKGTYVIHAGVSSRDLRLSKEIDL
ncbi:MAG: glycoside hydrolase family 3 C-terminal domain-containing protein [Bacteroidales bacterium]